MAGGRGPSWVLLGSLSAGIHILAGAAFFSVSPISGATLGPGLETWNLTPIMLDDPAPMPVDPASPPPEASPSPWPATPEPPASTSPPPPPPPPPPAPPPVPTVKLGVDNGKADSPTWIAGKGEGEHQGPVMGTEQPQLARNPGPGGQPSPGQAPAPAGASAPSPPAPESPPPAPTAPARPEQDRPPVDRPPADRPAADRPPAPSTPPAEPTRPVEPKPTAPGAQAPTRPSPAPARDAEPPKAPADSLPVPPFRVPEPVLDEGVGPDQLPTVSSPPPPPPLRERPETPPAPRAEPPVVEPPLMPIPDPLTNALRAVLAAAGAQPSEAARPQPSTPASAERPASPGASVPSPVAGGGDPNDRGAPSDRQSDASSVVRRRAEYRNGRVEAGEGIEIRTVRPVFSLVTRTMATPRSPLMEITFDRTGKAKNVRVLRSSGYGHDVDEPIISAMYQWRASGKALLELTEGGPGEVRLEITIRLGGG